MKVADIFETQSKLTPDEEQVVDAAIKRRMSIQQTADILAAHRKRKSEQAKGHKRRETDKK